MCHELSIIRVCSSQRVKPRKQLRIALPAGRLPGLGCYVNLLERSSLGINVCSCVMTGGVQLSMSKPRLNNSRIDTRCDQLDTRRVTIRVGRHSFLRQGRHLAGSGQDVPFELKANASGAERFAVAIDEYGFIGGTWSPSQQCLEKIHGFGPQRTDPSLTAFPEQFYLGRRFEPDGRGSDVESFLDACSGVVEEGKQCMIALSFRGRSGLLVFFTGILAISAHCASARGS